MSTHLSTYKGCGLRAEQRRRVQSIAFGAIIIVSVLLMGGLYLARV